jgi:hypothetical protein
MKIFLKETKMFDIVLEIRIIFNFKINDKLSYL